MFDFLFRFSLASYIYAFSTNPILELIRITIHTSALLLILLLLLVALLLFVLLILSCLKLPVLVSRDHSNPVFFVKVGVSIQRIPIIHQDERLT